MFIYSYNPASESAKELAEALGVKRIKHEGSRFKPNANKIIINWGSSNFPREYLECRVINNPQAVAKASNKLLSFSTLEAAGVSIPEYSSDPDYVLEALTDDDGIWLARQVLNGHSGEGIVIMEDESNFVDAPLYTKYVPKQDEYRVHVAGGNVISLQRKARRRDVPDEQINWKIRNLAGGFIFARDNVQAPADVLEQGVNAVVALGLDFGAADVIYNQRRDKAYVLEINTAPGLAGTTLEDYVRYFRGLI